MALDLIARLRLDDQLTSPLDRVNRGFRDTERATAQAAGGVRGFTSDIGKIAAGIGLTAALAGGFNLIKGAVGKALDRIDRFESFDRVMTALTGSSEKAAAAMDATNKAVKGTAYGLDVASKGVQDFVTRGMEVEKATDTMAAFGDAVAFYGDGSNEQLASVADALAKMYSKGKVGMDQMNRLFDAGIDGVGMYAKATNRDVETVQKDLSAGVISAQDFVETVSDAMMEGTNGVEKIAGAAKEAGASWGASMDNMQAAVARGVGKIITSFDELLEDNGLPKMREMISTFGSKFEDALGVVAGAVEKLSAPFGELIEILKPHAPVIEKLGKALLFTAAAIGVIAGMSLLITGLGIAFGILTSPLALVAGSIAALAFGFQLAYEKSEPFKKFIDDAIGKVMEFANMLATNSIEDIAKSLGISPENIAAATAVLDTISTTFQSMRDKVAEVIEAVTPYVMNLLATFEGVGTGISNVWQALIGVLQPIFTALGVAFGIIADIATIAFTKVIVPAITFAVEVIKLLGKIALPILDLLGSAFTLAFTMLKIMWDTVLKPFISYLANHFEGAFKTSTTYIESLGAGFDKLGGWISGAAGILKDFASLLSGIKVPDWVTTLGGKVKGAANFVAERFLGSSNGVVKSNYHGRERVPYDGYVTELHRNERVLTAQQADAYDGIDYKAASNSAYSDNRSYNYSTISTTKTGRAGGLDNAGVLITGNTFEVRKESDIDDIAEAMVARIIAAAEGGAL